MILNFVYILMHVFVLKTRRKKITFNWSLGFILGQDEVCSKKSKQKIEVGKYNASVYNFFKFK